jgi:outer membrane protein
MQIMRILLLVSACLGTLLTLQPAAYSAEADSAFKGLVIRARGLAVIPDEDATITVIGGNVDITDAYVPEVDLSYFFTENIAIEAIAAVTPHDVDATGTTLGQVDLGSVWLLPPTVLLQYHLPLGNGFKPYVGAGVNYTVFFNEDAPGGTVTSIDYDNTFGWALQAGVDYQLNERWMLNLDVKKVFISTDVSLNGGAINADVDIDPWIVGVGFGYKF